MARYYIYELYVELKDYQPKIWRRFKIQGNKTIAELGYALIAMYEMMASHLFRFVVPVKDNFLRCVGEYIDNDININAYNMFGQQQLDSICIDIPNEYNEHFGRQKSYDATKIKLNKVLSKVGEEMTFEYDFGDSWEIGVRLEGISQVDITADMLPCVTDGEGFGIIEDIGGVGGLEDFVSAMKKGSGEEYEGYCEWLGIETFDLEIFDISDVNYRLKKLMRIFKQCYEKDSIPTQASIDFIQRKYYFDD